MSESWNRPEGSGPNPTGPQGPGPGGQQGPPQQGRPPQTGGGYGPPGQQPGYGAPQPGQQGRPPQGPGGHGGQGGPGSTQPGAPTQPPAYGAPPGGWQQSGQGPGGGYSAQPSAPSEPKKSASTVEIVRYVVAGLSAVLVILGVSLPVNGDTMWAENTLWTIFAAVAALATVALALVRGTKDSNWLIGVSGLIALALFWVLIMLPGITSNNGFLVTVGLGLAALGLYFANEASAGSSGKDAAEKAAKSLT